MAGDRLAEQRRHSERWDVKRLIREEGPSPQPSGLAADEPEAKRLARGLLRVLQQEVILAPEFAGHVTNISKLLLCHDVAEPLRDEVLRLFADLAASLLQQLDAVWPRTARTEVAVLEAANAARHSTTCIVTLLNFHVDLLRLLGAPAAEQEALAKM